MNAGIGLDLLAATRLHLSQATSSADRQHEQEDVVVIVIVDEGAGKKGSPSPCWARGFPADSRAGKAWLQASLDLSGLDGWLRWLSRCDLDCQHAVDELSVSRVHVHVMIESARDRLAPPAVMVLVITAFGR